MARQKSEDRDKPQGRRKPAVTREDEPRAGGEAIPVNEAPKQLLLFRWNSRRARTSEWTRRSGSLPRAVCDARGAEASGQRGDGNGRDDGRGDAAIERGISERGAKRRGTRPGRQDTRHDA